VSVRSLLDFMEGQKGPEPKRLKVLLVQVDGKWPNLALMKLSTFHKAQGHDVALLRLPTYDRRRLGPPKDLTIRPPRGFERPDVAYISCIFTWNAPLAHGMAEFLKAQGAEVYLGGSGVDLKATLPDEVEHLMPDYDLYGVDFSMGFLTRGCIRRCPWCIVPQKEGHIKRWSPLSEFLHPKHRKVMLLDNNLLAHPDAPDMLRELVALSRTRGLMVCFTQGLDIRLITPEMAKLLRRIDYRDPEFNRKALYFAWDIPSEEEEVLRGIEVLVKAGIPKSHLRFYALMGYGVRAEDYTWEYFMENDWHRYETLSKLGVKMIPMIYNNRPDLPLARAFRKWCFHMRKARLKRLGELRSFVTYLRHEHPDVFERYRGEIA